MGMWAKVQARTPQNPTPEFIAIPDGEMAGLTIEQGAVMVAGVPYKLHQRDGLLGATAAQRMGDPVGGAPLPPMQAATVVAQQVEDAAAADAHPEANAAVADVLAGTTTAEKAQKKADKAGGSDAGAAATARHADDNPTDRGGSGT